MGWKSVKEHYRIGHIVQVTDEGICIGSGYIHNLIVIGMDGRIKKADVNANADLQRYHAEMQADPATLRALVQAPDTFAESTPVFTYADGAVLEKTCECLGWPNVTHDGALMYENTFSPDLATTVARAKKDAALKLRYAEEAVADAELKLARWKDALAAAERDAAALARAYPQDDDPGAAAKAFAEGTKTS